MRIAVMAAGAVEEYFVVNGQWWGMMWRSLRAVPIAM